MGTTTAIIVTLLAAYPLAKRDLPGRNAITMTFVFTMFFAGGLIPHYLLVRGGTGGMGLPCHPVVPVEPEQGPRLREVARSHGAARSPPPHHRA